MNETNHPSSLATCTLIQDFLGVKDGGIYEAVAQLKQRLDAVVAECALVTQLMSEQSACFNAAMSEGFHDAVMESGNVHLIDIYQRRLQPSIQCIPPTPATDAALAEVEAKAALPANWDDLLFNEMNRRFELKRHDDDYLTNGDTQIGVEFAIEFIKQLREAR